MDLYGFIFSGNLFFLLDAVFLAFRWNYLLFSFPFLVFFSLDKFVNPFHAIVCFDYEFLEYSDA